MTFCREVLKALIWIQCFPPSLEAPGQEKVGGGGWERGRELPLVLATARGNVFKESHCHQIRQAAQHAHEHTCTCTRTAKQPTIT